MKFVFFAIIVILLLLLAIIMGANNGGLIEINYFVAKSQIALSTLMALSFLFGVVFASIIWFVFALRLKWQVTQLNRSQRKSIRNENP